MVYVGCIFIVCLSWTIGHMVVKRYVFRDKFFKELISFALYLKNNISFRQIKIKDLFFEYSENIKNEFKEELKLLIESIEKDNFNNLKSKLYFLKQEEFNVVINFFSELGNASENIEIGKLELFINKLNFLSHSASEVRNKNEGFIYKLSLMIGVVICILII